MAKSNGPVLVLIAALLVVGAGAAGWFLFNKSDPAIAEPETPVPAPAAKTTTTTPTKAPTLAPPNTTVSETKDAPKQLPSRDYIVNGKVVHDHRAEGTPPIDLPPAIQPPDARKLRPASTGAITNSVREMMRECVAAIPAADRAGGKPKMESTIVVAVKDKVATITKAAVQLRDITGPSVEAARACIESKAVGLATPVEEADVESYDITTSLLF